MNSRFHQRLFCYGTLQVPQVMARMAGREFPHRVAVLPGYTSLRVCGTAYPGIVARPGAVTAGVVYSGLTAVHLRRLDRYEGILYRRRRVRVENDAGCPLETWVYVIAEPYRHRLSDEPWDFEAFARDGLGPYLECLVPCGRAPS